MLGPRAGAEPASIGLTVECSNAELRIVNVGGGNLGQHPVYLWALATAQLDRVTDFYSVGCRFESCWDRQAFQYDTCSVCLKSVYRAVMKKAL